MSPRRAILRGMLLLADAHGTPLGEFDGRHQAVDALGDLVTADPGAVQDCRVIELGEDGRRVGEPISHPAAA